MERRLFIRHTAAAAASVGILKLVVACRPTGDAPTSSAVLPNGRAAYVTNLHDGTLTVLNLAG